MFGLVYRAKGMLFCLPSVCLCLSHARSAHFIHRLFFEANNSMYVFANDMGDEFRVLNKSRCGCVAVWWLGYAHPPHLLGKHSRLFIYINAIVSRNGSVRWRKQLCRLANWMLRKNVTLNEVHEHTGTGAATKQGKQANAIVTCHYYCFKERVFFWSYALALVGSGEATQLAYRFLLDMSSLLIHLVALKCTMASGI